MIKIIELTHAERRALIKALKSEHRYVVHGATWTPEFMSGDFTILDDNGLPVIGFRLAKEPDSFDANGQRP